MNQPIFTDGYFKFEGHNGQIFELKQETWENHILRDRSRWYFGNHFEKILETLKEPDYILQSPSEQITVSYVKKYEDFYILNTVMARAYLYILVNTENNIIKTIYDNPKLKNWKCIYER